MLNQSFLPPLNSRSRFKFRFQFHPLPRIDLRLFEFIAQGHAESKRARAIVREIRDSGNNKTGWKEYEREREREKVTGNTRKRKEERGTRILGEI